ncbi:MAG: hypothetical protein WC783_01105 [Candidatus Paceibacterota bacterium]|jgi:hypothetical protein
MKPRDALPKSPEPRAECRMLDMNNEQTFSDIQSFENSLGIQGAPSREIFNKAVELGGMIAIAIYDGDRIIGMSYLRTRSHPSGSIRILRNLPVESVFTFGTVVVPDARGEGLQNLLFKKRIEVIRSLGKETLIGSFYGENGASVRTVFNIGGRVLLYEHDISQSGSKDIPQLIFEIDTTILNTEKEEINAKDAMTPDAALEALERGDAKIVVLIKSLGREGADIEARKAMEQILASDYVGCALQTVSTDENGVRMNGLLFRHLSTFPPDVAKRLKERKEKIKSLI